MEFFLLQVFFDFRPNFELILDLFVGDFVDLGLVKVVPDELGRRELFSDLNLFFNFGNLRVDFDEVLVVVAPAQPYFSWEVPCLDSWSLSCSIYFFWFAIIALKCSYY